MSFVHNMDQFLARSADLPPEQTDLRKALTKLPQISPEGPWIAGGAIRRTLIAEPLETDFDYFFKDEWQLEAFTAHVTAQGLVKLRETEHHIHYRGKIGNEEKERDVQAIKIAFYENAAAVIDSFDFTICMFAFDGETLTSGEHALWDLGRKRLAVHKITYPTASVRRMLKYGKQGFTVCNGAIAELLRQTANSPEALARLNIFYVD
jgi:hypothetical protein